jgi:predicted porin
LILGQHDTPYKMASRGFDLFADGIADNRSLMGQTLGGAASHDARLGNVIAYIAPAFSGLTLAGAYVAAAEAATTSAQVKGSAYSLAALYGAGPLAVNFGYQNIKGGDAAIVLAKDQTATAWKLGGSYTMDAIQVVAVYEKLGSSGSALGNAADQSNIYVGGKFNVSASDAVKLAYTSAGKINKVANTAAKQISLGYDHNLSKTTSVYALYTKLSNDSAQNYDLGYTADASSDAVIGNNGKSLNAFSLGLKVSF